MKRHNPFGRGDELAFADIAIAVVGPLAILMIISLLMAKLVGSSAKCEVADVASETRLAQDMQSWIADLDGTIENRRQLLLRHCGADEAPTSGHLPQTTTNRLAGLCVDSQEATFRRAQLTREAVDQRLARLASIDGQLAMCLGMQPGDRACRQQDPQAHGRLRRQVVDFVAALDRDIRESRDALAHQCGVTLPQPAEVAPASVIVLPKALEEACSADRETAFGMAEISYDTLLRRLALRDQAARALKLCVKGMPPRTCRSVSGQEADEVVSKLVAWAKGSENAILDLDRQVPAHCRARVPEQARESFVPPLLEGVCPDSAAALLQKASLPQDRAATLDATMRARQQALHLCGTPLTVLNDIKLFKKCGARLTDEIIKKIANDISKALTTGDYEHIEFIGYADDDPLLSTCENNVAISNKALSTTRAYNAYIGVIKELKNRDNIWKIIESGQLRFHVIGAGIDETPTNTNSETPTNTNRRRIEVRLIQSNTVKGEP